MQLKMKEPENNPEINNPEGQLQGESERELQGQPQETSRETGVSNNDYLNNDIDFLAEDGDLFGNQFTPNTGPGNDEPEISSKPRKLTKKEFYNSPRNRKDRDRIIISSIVIIAAAIFDVIRVNFWLETLKNQIQLVNDLSEQFGMGGEYMIDSQAIMRSQIIMSVIFFALGIGIFLFKSRACAITGLAFTIINCLYTIVVAHNFRWYWTIIAFGFAVVATISFNKNWQEYEENGDWKRDW